MADIRTDKLNKQSASVCVVGGGIIGSWTALHLAEAGVNTTLVEQFPLPHTRGSSHGLSRAFRFLGELELDRLDYSLSRWQALEKASGETLFIKTGLLNFGQPADPDLETFMAVLRRSDFLLLISVSIPSSHACLHMAAELSLLEWCRWNRTRTPVFESTFGPTQLA
jgi:glycine/D-amino acid oxidase-like deaminating enzyme